MRTLSLAWTSVFNRPIVDGRWARISYALTDVFFVLLGSFVVFNLRFVPGWFASLFHGKFPNLPWYSDQYLSSLFLYAALVVLVCQSQDLYRTVRTRSALDESLAVVKAVGLATLLLIVFIYLSRTQTISRLVVGFSGVLNVASLVAWRLLKRQVVAHRQAAGHGVRNVLIVGAGRVGQELGRYFEKNKGLGIAFKGFLDENGKADLCVLGRIEEFSSVVRAHFVDEVFITIPSKRELVKTVAMEARRLRVDVKVVPELFDGLGWRAPLEHLGDFPVMALHREPIPALGLFIKRLTDISLASLGLVLLVPLLAAIALAIKLDSPGPVLYCSRRVGRRGRRFDCYKFRTMVANANELKAKLRHMNQREGPFFKIANDPRLTRVGKFLRKHSLDEFPQFVNVLKGEMSLVGPRPHPIDDYEQYTLDHLRRLDVRPGVTGLWQVSARQDPSFEKCMALDLEYIENWDLWLDLKLLLRTVPTVFSRAGQ